MAMLSITDLKVSKGDGTLSANTDDSWTFTPSKDWNGEVEFSYSITDGNGGQDHKIDDKVFVRGNAFTQLWMVLHGQMRRTMRTS